MNPTVEERLAALEDRVGRLADTLATVELAADVALGRIDALGRERKWADDAINDRRSGLHGHVTGIHAKLDRLLKAVGG